MAAVRGVVCKQRGSNLFTVWSGPTEYRCKLNATFSCAVRGCDAEVEVFQTPSTGNVYIHPHACISKCIHIAAMRDWCARYLAEARFITRVCPTCGKTPMRITKPTLPLPLVEIYGSCLLGTPPKLHPPPRVRAATRKGDVKHPPPSARAHSHHSRPQDRARSQLYVQLAVGDPRIGDPAPAL